MGNDVICKGCCSPDNEKDKYASNTATNQTPNPQSESFGSYIGSTVGSGIAAIGNGVLAVGQGVGHGVLAVGQGVGSGVLAVGHGVGSGVYMVGKKIGKKLRIIEDEGYLGFKSKVDEQLKVIEKTYMYLRYIPLREYACLLKHFSREKSTLKLNISYEIEGSYFSIADKFIVEEIDEDDFDIFINNYIVTHDEIYGHLSENPEKCLIFKKILKSYYNQILLRIKKIDGDKDKFFKYYALVLGFLYCKGKIDEKIKFLFDLFAENNVLRGDDVFYRFNFFLYLIASYITLSTLAINSGKGGFLPPVDKVEIKKCLDACEIRDCENLLKTIGNKYFGENGEISYTFETFSEICKNRDIDDTYGFIFTSKGIRYYLEKYNVSD